MRSQCEECRRAGLECELDCYPCSNCVERGFSDVCPGQRVDAELAAQSKSSTDGSQQPLVTNRLSRYLRNIFSVLCAPFDYLKNRRTILRYLYLPILLFLPFYYFSQASTVLQYAENSKEEYDEWISVMGIRIVNVDNGTTATSSSSAGVELQVLSHSSTSDSLECGRATPGSIHYPPPYSSRPAPSSPLVRPSAPASVVKLQEAWSSYVDSRIMEWRILTTTACVFVAASPTIFQIPDASDDPITRSIAFLALCRALSGIIYGPIFPLYFRRTRAKTVHFAMLWSQEAKKSQKSVFWGPWIMLSLPAVATCWATIFYLLAIFSFIWRTGSTADPSQWSADNQTRPPMSVPLALALRITITAVTVADLGCMAWIWRTLRGYNRTVWKEEDCGGGFAVGADGRVRVEGWTDSATPRAV